MTSPRKIKSNRANARLSTGPNTAQGRARAARNAHRHGLSVLIFNDPERSADIDDLAFSIAGEGAEPDIMELARNIARAQIELARVRQARHGLLTQAFESPQYRPKWTGDEIMKIVKIIAHSAKRDGPDALVPPEAYQRVKAIDNWNSKGPGKLASILFDFSDRLMVLDRYERRALSRRKFAIRVFDRAVREAAVAASTDT